MRWRVLSNWMLPNVFSFDQPKKDLDLTSTSIASNALTDVFPVGSIGSDVTVGF